MTLISPTRPGRSATDPNPIGNAVRPSLSTGAERLHAHLMQHGQLTDVQAKAFLGHDPQGVLKELQDAWLVLHVPGGDHTRVGRAAQFIPVPRRDRPRLEETLFHLELLKGRNGTWSSFQRWLALDAGETLAAMRALVEAGYASGGPVGATFVFRVEKMPFTAGLPSRGGPESHAER